MYGIKIYYIKRGMCMKYYSEFTGKVYDTECECCDEENTYREKAELEEKRKEELKATRKERALEIENAIKELADYKEECHKSIEEKENNIIELKNKFIADYGSFNMTYKMPTTVYKTNNIFDFLFNFFDI